jgi:hypothetical protein
MFEDKLDDLRHDRMVLEEIAKIGLNRNILVYDQDAEVGDFTIRMFLLMLVTYRFNATNEEGNDIEDEIHTLYLPSDLHYNVNIGALKHIVEFKFDSLLSQTGPIHRYLNDQGSNAVDKKHYVIGVGKYNVLLGGF